VKRKYSPAVQARRDAKFRASLIRKSRNPIRFSIVLPADVGKLELIDWLPTKEEVLLEKLRKLKAKWDREELADLRRRVKDLEATIEADKKWLAEEARKQAVMEELGRKLKAKS
jgi:hypothetical protein